jgi:hypothetical protein
MRSALKYVLPALLFGGVASTAGSVARAEDAAGPGARAVVEKRTQLAGSAEARAYFQRAHGAPQWTEDGSIIQYFSGDQGDGAIYWSTLGGAHIVYGPLLEHFEAAGTDAHGDALADPLAGPGDDCAGPDVLKRQPFGLLIFHAREDRASSVTRWVCLGPKGAYLAPKR